jgi:hypothetical protein
MMGKNQESFRVSYFNRNRNLQGFFTQVVVKEHLISVLCFPLVCHISNLMKFDLDTFQLLAI